MFVDFFIKRPVFATVSALLIILAGAAVIPTLPIAQFPTLAPPQVNVASAYVGASAQTVETAVTIPLEQQINGAEGMKYLTSSSSSNGESSITATFDLDRDPDLAAVDIQNRVNTAQGRLPNAVKAIGITINKAGKEFQISVRAIGRLSESSQFETIILKTNADGTLVRLKDVGRAELGAEDYGTDLQFNGQDAVGLAVTQLSTANALDVHRRALAELDRLSKSFPPGMRYQVAFDVTDAVSESIRDVVFTVGSAILLVILVIFIFLGDWRTTMIHFIATPVSLIGTFIFVKLLGFSINTLTLFGITLATGLVVDDAIVVIENIERHIAEGEHDSHKAAAAATGEITSAVIATSLVLVAGVCPVAFFPGTTGILFRQFALTIAFSIAISAFNALTLTPALSALLLGRQHGEKNWFFRQIDRVIGGITNGYRHALRGFLRFRLVAVILFVAALGLTYFVLRLVPTGFVPNEDQGYFIIAVQAPAGASLQYTKAIENQIQTILDPIPEVQGTFAISGFSFAGNAPTLGIVFVPLKPYEQRKGDQHASEAIVNRIRGRLFGIS